MKPLNTIFESLLDDDFDIIIEPLDIPKLHNESIANELTESLSHYNGMVETYPMYRKAIESMQGFVECVDNAKFSIPVADNLADSYRNLLGSRPYKNNPFYNDRSYDNAIEFINRMKKVISIIEQIDNICAKVNKSIYVNMRILVDRDKWDRVIYLFPRNNMDEASKFLDNAVKKIEKIKGATIEIETNALIVNIK